MKTKVDILIGDCVEKLREREPESVHCVVTSPPYYGLRSYLDAGSPLKGKEIGCEKSPKEYVDKLVSVFAEIHRVLRADGVAWLNLGDSYVSASGAGAKMPTPQSEHSVWTRRPDQEPKQRGGSRKGMKNPLRIEGFKPKDLIGIPHMTAFALRDWGWYYRTDIVWEKPTINPESVKDRPTRCHEYIFLLSKSANYYYDYESILEPFKTAESENYREGKSGRNKRSVWSVAPARFHGNHFATFPKELIRPCIKAGCPEGGVVLDPFGGSGTVGEVAVEEGRNAVLIDLNPDNEQLIQSRIDQADRVVSVPLFDAMDDYQEKLF